MNNICLLGQLGFGFLTGFCSGYSLKKVSKVSAVVLGFFFISIQTLSYNGYLKVNMDKLQKDVDGALDLNKDGKVDMQDLKVAYDKVRFFLSTKFSLHYLYCTVVSGSGVSITNWRKLCCWFDFGSSKLDARFVLSINARNFVI